MDWFHFAIISVIGFSLAAVLRRILMKNDKTDAVVAAIVFQVLGAVIIGIFAFTRGFVFPVYPEYYLNYFLVGFLWAAATVFQLKAYHYLEASEAIIIGTLESVVIILAANFFLKEVFTLPMVIGASLVLTGVIVISKTKKKMTFNRGVFYSLGFCLFAGLGVINDAFMVKSVDPMSYLAIGFLLPALFLIVFSPQSLRKMKTVFNSSYLKKIVPLTVFYALGSITFVYAILQGAQVSQLGPISNSSIILTVLLATVFLGERDHLLRKCIATVLVFAGVLLLR